MICKTCMKFRISMTLLRFHQDVGTRTHIVCGYCPAAEMGKYNRNHAAWRAQKTTHFLPVCRGKC